MEISELIKNIKSSATVEINSIAQVKKSMGERIFNLSAGEPVVPQPEIVRDAAIKAVTEGETRYPPVAGLEELRELSANWMNEFYKTDFNSKEVVVTAGGKLGLYSLCQALLNPGDEALVIAPYWVSYPSIVELFGGVPKIVKTEAKNNWKVDLHKLDTAYTKNTKFLIFNNGSNPTGTLYEREEIEKLLKWARKKKVVVISDEVYSGLVYNDSEYISVGRFPEFKDNIFILQSCSKSFAMTGWRIGFVFGNVDMIKKLISLQGQMTSGAPTIGQWAAIEAMKNAEEITKNINAEMKFRKDYFLDKFKLLFKRSLDQIDSALYAFVPMKKILNNEENDSLKFAKDLMENANIACVPGIAFGQEGYIRFSFGETIEEIDAALTALYNYVSKNG